MSTTFKKDLNFFAHGIVGDTYTKTLDDREFLIKKIECTDKSYATKIFEQYLSLQTAYHPNISLPKEVFITWKEEISSPVVNVVFESYTNSLEKFINEQRGNYLQPEFFQRCVGQLVEALCFLDQHGMFHGNLKPSNIFLDDNMNVILGDIGLPAVLSDVAVRTRSTDGELYKYTELEYLYRIENEPKEMKKYYSPEKLKKDPSSSKGDVFSLGLIVLELLTLNHYKADEVRIMQEDLQRNANSFVFESEIENLELVKLMTQFFTANRMKITELSESPLVKPYVDASQTEKLERRRALSANVKFRDISSSDGVEKVLEELKASHHSEAYVRSSFQYLCLRSNKDLCLSYDDEKCIVNAAEYHLEIMDIGESVMELLFNLLPFSKEDSFFFTVDCARVVSKISKHHQMMSGVLVMFSLSCEESGCLSLCRSGCLATALYLLQLFPDNLYLSKTICQIVWSVSSYDDNWRTLNMMNIPRQFLTMMLEMDFSKESVVENVMLSVSSISFIPEATSIIKELSGVSHILKVMASFKLNPRIVRYCCIALGNFVNNDELCAYHVLIHEPDDGLNVLKSLYEPHKDNCDVIEALCVVLNELARYDEIGHDMLTREFPSLFKEIQLIFSSIEGIKSSIENASTLLNKYKIGVN